jgi:hypothetical protein
MDGASARAARMRVVVALSVVALTAGAACSSGTASTTSTQPPTTASAPTTTLPASLKSDRPGAVLLHRTLLTAAELATTTTTVSDYIGDANNPTPVQGAISVDGIISILPSEVAGLYRDSLSKSGAKFGANRTYQANPGPVIDLLAIKFEDGEKGKIFVEAASTVAISLGGAKSTVHPEVSFGLVPVTVLRVPPFPGSTPLWETVAVGALYADGVSYLISVLGPAGSVSDAEALRMLAAQDAKYQSLKAEIAAAPD